MALRCLVVVSLAVLSSGGKPVEEQTALVTGASSGIGLQISRELAMAGMKVVMCARRIEKLKEEAKAMVAAGAKQEPLITACDVASGGSLDSTFEFVAKSLDGGTLDLVVANAGVEGHFGIGTFEDCPDEEMHSLNAINQFGTLATLKRSIPYLKKAGGGNFVFSGSIGTISTQRGFDLATRAVGDVFSSLIPYLATKAAIDLTTRLAAGVYARDNINVYCGAWGPTESEMQDRLGERYGGPGSLSSFNPLFKHTNGGTEPIGKMILAIADGSTKLKSGDILISDHDAFVHAKAFFDIFWGGGSDANNGWLSFDDLKNFTFDYKGEPYDFENSKILQEFIAATSKTDEL